MVWGDDRGGGDFNAYGLRLTASGNLGPGWPTDGKFVAFGPLGILRSLIPDGIGGAYLIYEINGVGYDLYAQHLTATGTSAPGWPANGLAIATGPNAQDEAKGVADDSGGVFIVWQDLNINQVRGVRLHPDGSVAPGWTVGGRTLSTLGSLAAHPDIASDGAGGLVASWWERRSPGTDYPAYGFRLTPSGNLYPGWPASGVPLTQRHPMLLQYQAYVASDGLGGMYCAWADRRNLPPGTPVSQWDFYWDIYSQHVLGDGTIAPGWSADANPLCTAAETQWFPTISSDAKGGAIVEWQDYRSGGETPFATRVRSDGTLAPGWIANGTPAVVSQHNEDSERMISDGAGGAYIGINDLTGHQCWVQHLMPDGSMDPSFGDIGKPVTTGGFANQNYIDLVTDGAGGLYAAWEDNRAGYPSTNIWASHLGPDLATDITVSLATSDEHPDHVLLVWQAPGALRASVERREGSGALLTLAEISTDGEYRLTYDDHAVTQGSTYAYRLSYSDGTATAYSPESTVLVPRAFTLALGGFRPNPSTSGDAAVAFELPDSKPGRLELLDVTGRRIADRDLSGYVAGRYSVRLSEGARVPAGMYWIRLTHGGRALTTRGVVIR